MAVDGVDLEVPAGQHPRRARPERRRQVHHGPHAHHDDHARRRHGRGGRARRRPARPPPSAAIIGVTGQDATLDELLTGTQNLVLVGELSKLAPQCRAPGPPSCSSASTLTDAADRMVKTYSGGMRRRLDLAASLMTRPPVLFLDEPTTGLDPTSRQRMWDVIRELVADGTTLLLTTQYLDEADALADAISVIDHGTVIAARHRRASSRPASAASSSRSRSARAARPAAAARWRRSPPARSITLDDGRRLRAPVVATHGHRHPRDPGPRRTSASRSTTSRSTTPRSTTCSSPSPVTGHRRRRPPTPTPTTPELEEV